MYKILTKNLLILNIRFYFFFAVFVFTIFMHYFAGKIINYLSFLVFKLLVTISVDWICDP